MRNPKVAHSFEVAFELPAPLEPLRKLATNYRWTWDHDTRDLFRTIDKGLWEASEHNPIGFLYSIPAGRLEKLAKDNLFLARLENCSRSLDQYLASETWFSKTYPDHNQSTRIAYFCAEFGVSEGLPIYSGGLGILAGDHLKAASDLGVPLVGVGLLYARGYFRQKLTHDGWQQEVYPQYDYYQMPLQLVRGSDDQPIRVEVELPDRTIVCQIWRADVGRIPLFLLDSNLLENMPADQGITDTLYGGDEEMRIRQEMILGIGGMRALRAMGLPPTVCHMNEGHAAFLSLERIRQFMQDHQTDLKTARQVVVAGNVFTTHTPVPAGFDVFPPDLLRRYLGKTIEQIGLTFESFLELGRIDPLNHGEAFNMAILAMENANRVNGVAKLHAKVSREMFQARWPNYSADEVPVDAITNGIHTSTWISHRMQNLFDEYLSPEWRRDPANPEIWKSVFDIPDADLWAAIESQRADLIRFARKRLQRGGGLTRTEEGTVDGVLDPRVLTIGFARRFATYKRGSLMLTDRGRLKALLFHAQTPIQILIAGKSHPRDDAGKKVIQDLVNFIRNEGARARMVFLEDYDMRVGRMLVQGVDLWLNNPRRPNEASGTSGMKVVPNGGLNCSVLDGWWDEAYNPRVGFAIGDASSATEDGHQDWLDSRALYSLLENEIAPRFYQRNESGIPVAWLEMVKNSMAELGPYFSTARMVHDYTSKFYVPAAEVYGRLSANGLERAISAREWRKRVENSWERVRVESVASTAARLNAPGSMIEVTGKVALGDLTPQDVEVLAMVGTIGPARELVSPHPIKMDLVEGGPGHGTYRCQIPCERPGHLGYAIRVVPFHPDVDVPSELGLVRWEG